MFPIRPAGTMQSYKLRKTNKMRKSQGTLLSTAKTPLPLQLFLFHWTLSPLFIKTRG